jgi:hypothetical protein
VEMRGGGLFGEGGAEVEVDPSGTVFVWCIGGTDDEAAEEI